MSKRRRVRRQKPAKPVRVPMINIQRIYWNDDRRPVNEETVAQLMDSIPKFKLQHPISVAKEKSGFKLIAGLNRLEAYRRLGHTHIPAIVHEVLGKNDAL